MAADMETTTEQTEAWLPNESFLSDQNWVKAIASHIKTYYEITPDENTSHDDVDFIGRFMCMLHKFNTTDQLKITEALLSIQDMWEKFTKRTGYVNPPPSFPNSPSPSKSLSNSNC